MSTTAASSSYVMSHTDAERRRLALQASVINPFTTRFLSDAGVSPGMRVLDLGCGVGDVSLIAARLVGPRGSVTGVDIDPDALAIAAARAKEEGLPHVRFMQADLSTFQPDAEYDALTARHILIHTPDPVALIRRARTFVRPGGILAFQEFDLSFFGPKFDDMPIYSACSSAVAALFERARLAARAGSLLYTWCLDAGLPVPVCRLEYLVEGGEASIYYEWFAETMRSLMPKMLALGILDAATFDIQNLEANLRREALHARRPFFGGPLGSAFVRTPLHSHD